MPQSPPSYVPRTYNKVETYFGGPQVRPFFYLLFWPGQVG